MHLKVCKFLLVIVQLENKLNHIHVRINFDIHVFTMLLCKKKYNLWKPYYVVSVNMSWQDISILSRAIATTHFFCDVRLFYESYEFMIILEYVLKLRL